MSSHRPYRMPTGRRVPQNFNGPSNRGPNQILMDPRARDPRLFKSVGKTGIDQQIENKARLDPRFAGFVQTPQVRSAPMSMSMHAQPPTHPSTHQSYMQPSINAQPLQPLQLNQNILLNKDGGQKFIFFYSRHCPHSKQFTNALYKNQELHNNFIKINIDMRNQPLPDWLKRVPTIVVYENNKREILTDRHAFEWLSQKLGENNKEIQAYNPVEMSSKLTDVFAFIDGQTGTLDYEKQAEHNFSRWDIDDQHFIITPEGYSNNRMGGQKDVEFEANIERLKQQRNMDVPNQRPPQANIDFTKGYRQDSDMRKITNYDVNQIHSQWKRDQKVLGPQPRRAPNFQSARFKSDFRAQGGNYQDCGLGAGGFQEQRLSERELLQKQRNYENFMKSRGINNRGRQPPPNLQPNFQVSARNIKIV